MAYSALAVANAFIDRATTDQLRGLTPMKLQKLLFYTQSWHLREKKGPLMDDHFARWQYGPVIPSLYHELKSHGGRPITSMLSNLDSDDGGYVIVTPTIPENDEYAHRLIDRIIKKYGRFSGTQLSNLSHEPGTAWALKGADGSAITWEEMSENIHPATAEN
jgi:uncharacterized phage-associated protein